MLQNLRHIYFCFISQENGKKAKKKVCLMYNRLCSYVHNYLNVTLYLWQFLIYSNLEIISYVIKMLVLYLVLYCVIKWRYYAF